MATTQSAKQPTTFLDLPAELRNKIYDLSGCLQIWRCSSPNCKRAATFDIASRYIIVCSKDDKGIHRCFTKRAKITLIPSDIRGETRAVLCAGIDGNPQWDRPHIRDLPTAAKQPALTKVCCAIRKETLPMFYGSNHFVVSAYKSHNARKISEDFFKMIGPSNTALLRVFINNIKSLDYDMIGNSLRTPIVFEQVKGFVAKNNQVKKEMRNEYMMKVKESFLGLGLHAPAFTLRDKKRLEDLTGCKLP